MKRYLALCAVLFGFLLAGCETLNHSQYKVSPMGNDKTATLSAADRDTIREIVSSVAKQFKLTEMTDSSVVPNTIAFFTEVDATYPMQIKVYTDGNMILVDLMHSHPYGGETERYMKLKSALVSELNDKFGDRVRITPVLKLQREKPPRIEPPPIPRQ
jgi:hypothetical protein